MADDRMMRRREFLASGIIIFLLAATGIVIVLFHPGRTGYIQVYARMAETGGWTPENLTTTVGKPLHLKLTSEDVVHGFAVGHGAGMPEGVDQVEILPGEFSEITLTFNEPGRYTFYCTRWCSLNHWRMRGVIEVKGDSRLGTTPETQALYAALGLQIDSPHPAQVVPGQRPSASRGEQFADLLPGYALTQEYYQSHSPAELFQALRLEPDLAQLSDQNIWELVAYTWRANSSPEKLEEGRILYAQNCAACHGEAGDGNGVFAGQLAPPESSEHADMKSGEMMQAPVNFTDPSTMLGAKPAVLHGKILRGGMGTGMPYWGPILTDDQIWALVSHLWTFQFDP